ncbi:MAG: Flagellar brake protein YcgR [Syntrophorhabdus sp. PtaU1.Bin058]|nr:MAG: Flagellar brake protein YcgR [Syntrophorhabdus sp. PtaU1.Bin058]
MNVKPGTHIAITVDIDPLRETIDVKNSIVHDVIGEKIIIAQTDPPILKSYLNKTLHITYIEKEGGRPLRYGFPARVLEFIKDYKLTSSETAQAIALTQEADTEPYNLRMFYRLEPPSNSGLDIYIKGERTGILDISIGGASFSHNKGAHLQASSTIGIILSIDGAETRIDAQVLRVKEPESDRLKKSLEIVSISFLNMPGNTKNTLSRKIRDIERTMRFENKFYKGSR